MTSINNDGNMHNIGQWNYLFAGSWTGTSGYYKGGTDLNDLEVYIGSNNNTSEEWGAQLKTNALSLNAGKTYNYSISLESDKAGAEVLLKNDTDGIELQRKTLTNGKNVFAGTITSEKGNAELIFALGKVAAGTTLKVTDFTISDSSGEITTKVPETTKVSETTTKIAETTTASGNKPETPFGLVVNCPSDNTISVVWGNVVGNLYNIYIDGVKVKEAVGCAEYRFEGYSAGSHTVEVCTIKDGIESDKISGTVNVTGKGEITTKAPETTTKIAETTTKKPEQTTNKQEQTTKTPETTTKTSEATTKAPEQTTNKQEQTTKATEVTNNDGANQSTIQPTADKNVLTVGKAKITKKKSLKKKIKITLKRVTNAKGYIVQYSTVKNFAKKKTKTITAKKTAVVLKKLKSNKKYYIRVRGYAVLNNEKVYGKWSGKTSVKTK